MLYNVRFLLKLKYFFLAISNLKKGFVNSRNYTVLAVCPEVLISILSTPYRSAQDFLDIQYAEHTNLSISIIKLWVPSNSFIGLFKQYSRKKALTLYLLVES